MAIRGHWMQGTDHKTENCILFQAADYVETTFEHQYLVKARRWKKMQFSGGCVLRAVLTSRQKKSAQVSVSSARAFNAAEIESVL